MLDEPYVDTSKISIREINTSVAKDMIVKNHYSHAWTMCSCAIGVFYEGEEEHQFFDGDNEKLIGCIIYGSPVGRSAANSFSSEVKINEVYEITRLFIHDGYGKNIESYVIGQSMKYIKKHRPQIKVILSYSDSEQGHVGGIYKATNAYYQGNGEGIQLMPNFSISLKKDPYEWIHSRTVFSKYGSHNVEKLKKAVGTTFYRKKESGKHRYFWILSNKPGRKKIIKTLKHPTKPYPKKSDYIEVPVEEYIIELKDNTNTFF